VKRFVLALFSHAGFGKIVIVFAANSYNK